MDQSLNGGLQNYPPNGMFAGQQLAPQGFFGGLGTPTQSPMTSFWGNRNLGQQISDPNGFGGSLNQRFMPFEPL